MSTDNSPMEELLSAISHYEEEVSENQSRIAEENEAYRARTARFHMAIDHAVADLDESFTKFFETADIDVFADWETAAPLYRAGWNNGRVSRGFMEGFQRLIEEQDTYLNPIVGWTCHAADIRVQNPILRMTITLPAEPNEDKMDRTAELAEKLFVPMTQVDASHRLPVTFYWMSNELANVFIKKDILGEGYAVHSRGESIADFVGSMTEVMERLAEYARFANEQKSR